MAQADSFINITMLRNIINISYKLYWYLDIMNNNIDNKWMKENNADYQQYQSLYQQLMMARLSACSLY